MKKLDNGTYNGFLKIIKTWTWNILLQSGDKYSGQWNEGNKHSKGSYIKSGIKYVGQWKKNNMHGQGTKTYKNGKIERGTWENDKFISLNSVKSSSKNQLKAKDTIKSIKQKMSFF